MFSFFYAIKHTSSEAVEGHSCDNHPDRPAVVCIQGETDSFDTEYMYFCEECEATWDTVIAFPVDDGYECTDDTANCQPPQDTDGCGSSYVHTGCEVYKPLVFMDYIDELEYYADIADS